MQYITANQWKNVGARQFHRLGYWEFRCWILDIEILILNDISKDYYYACFPRRIESRRS